MIRLAIAFIFGFLHALEPGHGKTAMITYLSSEKKSIKNATIISVVSALTHTLSIFLIALIVHGVTYHGGRIDHLTMITHHLNIISGLLIAAMGAWVLLKFKNHSHTHHSCCSHHHHDHHHDHHHAHNTKPEDKKTGIKQYLSLSMLGVAIGMVPCPSVMVAYLTGASSSHHYAGILSVICFGLGMSLSLMMIMLIFSEFNPSFMDKLKGGTLSKKWPLIQGTLFIIIGIITALYH